MNESIKLTKENRQKLAYEGAKMLYGFSTVKPELCGRIFAPPLTWRQRLHRIKDVAIQVALVAASFLCFAFAFAMIFRMAMAS